MKRDVVFLVADAAMEQVLRGLFGREHCHRSLGCRPFSFVAGEDVVVAPGSDPGVYRLAADLLRHYERSHQFAVVMLDADWGGSPGAALIRERITKSLVGRWQERFAVIVIEPELEAWVWQDNPHVATALKCPKNFRNILRASGHWPDGVAKPADPKAALTHLRRHHGADRSNAALGRLAGTVSVRHCTDPAFGALRNALRNWLPVPPEPAE
ncbi:MAG TPA: hypothetical protein VFX70_13510 [Mycobacteriales bacterium]|nr:hypothetical protein [Mycobacteriales bacterium]